MEALREVTINDIKELAESEKIGEIGPLFENDQDLQEICNIIKVEFGGIEKKFEDLHSVWQGQHSNIKKRFDKELLDLITEVENNRSEKLKEQLKASRLEIENLMNRNQSLTISLNDESKAKESLEKENALLKKDLEQSQKQAKHLQSKPDAENKQQAFQLIYDYP